MAMCGSRKSTSYMTHERAMEALHLLSVRGQLHLDVEPGRATAGLIEMCDLLHGHLRGLRGSA